MSSKKTENILLSLVLLTSLLVTLYCQFPLLTNKYAINDDVRQEIYLYSQFRDKELFRGDLISNFFSKWNPWGLNIFYFIVSLFYDPVKFTKVLPFFICTFSTLYMFRIGKLLKGSIAGFLTGFIFIFVAWSREVFDFFATGNQGDFAVLFCIMFLYYFLKGDFCKTMLILVLQALFYPPVLLICLLTYLISIIFALPKGLKIERKKILLLIGTLLVIVSISWLKYSDGQLELITLKEMKGMEEFYPGGRKPIFFSSLYQRWTNNESGLAIDFPLKWLLLVSFLTFLPLRKKALNIAHIFWDFIFASSILFVIANILMFRLHGPARYMRYSLPIFLIIFTALNIDKFLKRVKSKDIQLIFLSSFALLTAICFVPKLQRYYIIAPSPGLYNFLLKLPKDILIAGHPTPMDNIPTFAKRKVFINEETSLPYYSNFYPIIKERTHAFFKAYYSDSSEEIYDFCKKFNITHLVVYKSHFSDDYLTNGQFYLNPFNDYIRNLVKNKSTFALINISENKRVFDDGDIFVVKTEGIFSQE